jgi:hypothetical protein
MISPDNDGYLTVTSVSVNSIDSGLYVFRGCRGTQIAEKQGKTAAFPADLNVLPDPLDYFLRGT